MLRGWAIAARMLCSCSRVSCYQGFKSQSSPPNSFSRVPALGVHGSGLHQQGQRLITQPASLWSAVFQGHLGRPQLFSFRTAAAAAGSAGPSNSHDTEAQLEQPTAKQSGAGPLQALNRQRRSTSRKTSSKQAVDQQSPEQGSGASSSSSSKIQAKAEELSLGAQLLAQPHGDPSVQAAGQQQPVQQHAPEQVQQQQQALLDGQQRTDIQQQSLMASASAADVPVQQTTQQPAKSPPRKQIGPKKSLATASSRAAQEAGKPASSSSQNTNSRQSSNANGSTGSSSRSSGSSNPSTVRRPPAAAAAAAVGAPSREASLALQSAFIQPAPLLPPSTPVSEAVLAWAEGLEDQPLVDWTSVLKDWKAGMATVKHPFTQQQVDVLALPYYRHGKLVDVRYLHIVDRCLEASWLAAEACEPFLRDTHLQGAHRVVFVGSELDALLLTATQPDWPVIALTQQTPQWYPSDHHQQQQHLLWQQQQVTEDPRRRLVALQDELLRLRQEYELGQQRQAVGAAAPSRDQGLAVADAAVSSPTGLQLLLHQLPRQPSGAGAEQQPAEECVAVIALPDGPGLHTLSVALATLLGELHCRQAVWPSAYASPAALYDHRLALALQGKAAAEAAAAASAGEAADAAAAAAADTAAAAHTAAREAAVQDFNIEELVVCACTALTGLASPPVMHSWSVLAVHFLRDVLQPAHGGVLSCLADATVWPLTGLERFADHAGELLQYWDQTDVNKVPRSTGWPALDDFYKVCPGEVTIVTGVPNSGKSEWLDALAVNLAESEGWRFALCSMEKKPRDHARQLLEKHVRKPLLQADYSRGVPQMSEMELADAYDWLCHHFYVIAAGDGNMPTLTWVLEKARAAKMQYGIDGLIIDPYNELDPSRASGLKEHEHVNQTMAMLRKFARDYNVAVWLVAHPRQFGNWWTGQRPGLQDISGGANFANKADNGIVVHRDWTRLKELRDRAAAARGKAPAEGGRGKGRGKAGDKGAEGGAVEEVDPLEELKVLVHIDKVRNKSTGSRGESVLYYDKASGRYFDAFAGQEFDDWAASIQQLAQARAHTAQAQQQQQAEHEKHQLELSAAADLPSSNGSSPRPMHTSSSSGGSDGISEEDMPAGSAVAASEADLELTAQLEAQLEQEVEERSRELKARYGKLTEGKVEEINLEVDS